MSAYYATAWLVIAPSSPVMMKVLASWRFFTPILEKWKTIKPPNFPNYQAKWGPSEADVVPPIMVANGAYCKMR